MGLTIVTHSEVILHDQPRQVDAEIGDNGYVVLRVMNTETGATIASGFSRAEWVAFIAAIEDAR